MNLAATTACRRLRNLRNLNFRASIAKVLYHTYLLTHPSSSVKLCGRVAAMSSERSSKATYDSHVSILSSELAAWLLEASHRPETYCSLANIFASGDTKLYDPPSTKLALDSIFKRLSSVLCDGRDKSTVIWALASLLGEKRMLLMEARLWSTEKLPGQDTLPSDSRASSVSGHSIGPSFTQFQTESYTASRPSLSSLAPDENGVDSNRTSATPYSFGSRGKFDGKNTAEYIVGSTLKRLMICRRGYQKQESRSKG